MMPFFNLRGEFYQQIWQLLAIFRIMLSLRVRETAVAGEKCECASRKRLCWEGVLTRCTVRWQDIFCSPAAHSTAIPPPDGPGVRYLPLGPIVFLLSAENSLLTPAKGIMIKVGPHSLLSRLGL